MTSAFCRMHGLIISSRITTLGLQFDFFLSIKLEQINLDVEKVQLALKFIQNSQSNKLNINSNISKIYILCMHLSVLNFQMNSTDWCGNNGIWCKFQFVSNVSCIKFNTEFMHNGRHADLGK